ncbi:hypothetical protein [Pseudomonas endophytica]|nr:hypothetical protein [Pseudomonas endophytica]
MSTWHFDDHRNMLRWHDTQALTEIELFGHSAGYLSHSNLPL